MIMIRGFSKMEKLVEKIFYVSESGVSFFNFDFRKKIKL